MLTESVCQDLQIEPHSIDSKEPDDDETDEKTRSLSPVILAENPSSILLEKKNKSPCCSRDRSLSPVPCECLENWSPSPTPEKPAKDKSGSPESRSVSPDKERSVSPEISGKERSASPEISDKERSASPEIPDKKQSISPQ